MSYSQAMNRDTEVVGVMGGSYDPVHIGHMMVASFIAQSGAVDEVWMSMSPASPLKDGRHPASDTDRMTMLQLAVEGAIGLRAIDTELSLPRPSYTVTLLDTLAVKYPHKQFKLIIGSDNWLVFDRWYAHDEIISRYGVIIYPRPGYPVNPQSLPQGVSLIEAPNIEISSTFIRQEIRQGKDMNFFLPAGVFKYITQHKLYR